MTDDSVEKCNEFSKEKLIELLFQIIQSVENKTLSENIQEDIWEYLTWNKDDLENKKIVKYLFTGYWIHFLLNESNRKPED
jgi:hypothetical protein